MKISKNTQLGLMLFDNQTTLDLLNDLKLVIEKEKDLCEKRIGMVEDGYIDDGYSLNYAHSGNELFKQIAGKLGYQAENIGSEFYTTRNINPFLYLIQSSVHTCAEMIRIKENFSCVVFAKIKDGEHVYLMGRDEVARFVKFNGAIRGLFWNRVNRVAFEFGFDMETDQYYFPETEKAAFNRIVRLMTFIELGDIEVEVLEKGRNNGKTKKAGKITNDSDFKIFIVDSSWNKIIIRTEGFAVRGHFRLQPCGENLKDRELIWIDAFEKHGYSRKAKSAIITDD